MTDRSNPGAQATSTPLQDQLHDFQDQQAATRWIEAQPRRKAALAVLDISSKSARLFGCALAWDQTTPPRGVLPRTQSEDDDRSDHRDDAAQ